MSAFEFRPPNSEEPSFEFVAGTFILEKSVDMAGYFDSLSLDSAAL